LREGKALAEMAQVRGGRASRSRRPATPLRRLARSIDDYPESGARAENTITKGDILVVRRFVTIAVSLCLVLGVGIVQVHQSFAQGEAKKETQPPKSDSPTKDAAKPDAAKTGAPKAEDSSKAATKPAEAAKEPAKPAEPPLPPIPAEVQAKLEAARKAVAEAIVAAQDAGLVETSIDPPPILDILITGRAVDARALKSSTAKKPYTVSPEVFCAWFTGYGKLDGIDYVHDVRITNPSAGLKQWFDQRASILRTHIDEIRKAKGPAPTPKKDESKPEPAKKALEEKKK
jgi:hypothetical protein